MSEMPLTGGRVTAGVVRIGDTVRRPMTGDRSLQHDLLKHLERHGFAGAPRFLGIDEAGREMLSFLPGDVPADLGAYDDSRNRRGGAAAARLPRRHRRFRGGARGAAAETICHNDFAPTNAVFRDGHAGGADRFRRGAAGPAPVGPRLHRLHLARPRQSRPGRPRADRPAAAGWRRPMAPTAVRRRASPPSPLPGRRRSPSRPKSGACTSWRAGRASAPHGPPSTSSSGFCRAAIGGDRRRAQMVQSSQSVRLTAGGGKSRSSARARATWSRSQRLAGSRSCRRCQ